jgi:hypothetical protein
LSRDARPRIIPDRRQTRHLHNLPTLRAPPPDLYDWTAMPTHRLGRPAQHDLADWRVVDDWPAPAWF